MKYSEKREVEDFVCSIANTIHGNIHNPSEIARLCHNAKIEIKEFLDDDLSYRNIKTFSPKDTQREDK